MENKPTPQEKNTLEQVSKRLVEIISQHTGVGRRGKKVLRIAIIREMADRIQARAEARARGTLADTLRLASIARREIDDRL